ncbi:MAG: MFS transporter [Acidobacteriota bacterium]
MRRRKGGRTTSMSDQHPTPAPDRSALGVVYFTVFLDLLGFGIILPWLPFYAATLGASGLGLGLLFTAYSLAQMVGATWLGQLSDRFGRRPILLMSLVGSAAGLVLCGLATSLVALCLARAVAGLFGGSVSIAQAYVADVTSPAERPRYMGFIGASIGLGFVFGPAMGAGFIALDLDFSAVAYAAAGLAAVNFVLAFWRLGESKTQQARASRWSRAAWREAFSRPGLARVLVATVLTTYAFVSMETTFAFLGRDRFALDNLGFGLVLTFVGVVMVLVQGGLIGRLTQRFGVRRVAATGGILMGVALTSVPLAPVFAVVVAGLSLLAAGQGLVVPGLAALASQIADADNQGSVLGVRQSLAAGARAFGPLIAGTLYDSNIGLPYFVAGAMAILAGLLVATVGLRDSTIRT